MKKILLLTLAFLVSVAASMNCTVDLDCPNPFHVCKP
jgi:hypothetical protein